MRRTFLVLFVAALSALTAGLLIAARRPDPNAVPTTIQVAERTMSPFCPGLTLSECPSSQSVELRDRIAEKVDAGWTNSRIDDWLIASYGESVLARPRAPVAFAIPIALLMSGAVAVMVLTFRWARARQTGPPELSEPFLSDADRQRLAAEMRTFAEGTE